MTRSLIVGKPWKNIARFSDFEEADQKRSQLLKKWQENKVEGMQVKIRRMNSPAGFVVKTRLHPDFDPPPPTKKKNGKNSKRNKKNSSRRKPDSSGSV